MHCSWRRLLWRGLEFHVFTINNKVHTKKVWKLIEGSSYITSINPFFTRYVLTNFPNLLHIFMHIYTLYVYFCVTYWPSTEPSIKKQVHPVEDIGISPWPVDVVEFGADAYAHRKQVYVKQLYNQVPQAAWASSVRVAVEVGIRVAVPVRDKIPEWETAPDRVLELSGPTIEQPSRMRKKCCYGQRNLGSICGSLSPSPTHLSYITNINPFATLSQPFQE